MYGILSHFTGRVIVSGSDDFTLKIWNIHSSQCKSTLLDHTDTISAIKISVGTVSDLGRLF